MLKFLKPRNLLFVISIPFIISACNTINIDEEISRRDSPASDFTSGKGDENQTTVKNFWLLNSRNGQPFSNYMIYILDIKTGDLVTSAKSIRSGEAKIEGLIHGKEYIIKAAIRDEDGTYNDIKEETPYIHNSTENAFVVETYIERNASYIDVPIVMQNPELPNGCEITALTSILNYYGMNVSKTTMADKYLPKVAFRTLKDKRVGPNPHIAYAGNPRDLKGGWYVFATPIADAAKKSIAANKMDLTAENVSGSTREEILSYIDQSIPVVVWVTRDLSPPIRRGGWYIEGKNEFHSSYTNLHAVVLNGWNNGKVHIMNPLKGHQSISEEAFFDSYEALGSQAVIIKK